jgi:hypothetical protein
MPSAIDHIIIAVADPDAAAAELESTILLRSSGGGRHDAHGTYNRLIWLGDSYIELMGVFDGALADASWWGRHVRSILARTPAALAGVPLAAHDLANEIDRLRARGSTLLDPVAGERVRADGQVVRWSIGRLPSPDPDLGLVFLIEHDTSGAEWRPDDRAARASETHPLGGRARLIRLETPVRDPARTAMRLLREFGLQFRPSLAGAGARDTTIGDQVLRLVPYRGEAAPPPEIVIRGGSEDRHAELLGCRWSVQAGQPAT